jgi:hypothetical protein
MRTEFAESVEPINTDEMLRALYPWKLLVFNDVVEAADITLDKGETSRFDAPIRWAYDGVSPGPSPGFSADPPIEVRPTSLDWTIGSGHKTIDYTPAKPEPKALRAYIVAPDYSRAIPLGAVEFHREDGRVVWSEGEWPPDAKPLSPAQLESLRNLKVNR